MLLLFDIGILPLMETVSSVLGKLLKTRYLQVKNECIILVMTIKNMVPELLKEAGCTPVALVYAGISTGVAYRWGGDNVERYDADVIDKLCAFFTRKLGRFIDVGDVLRRERVQPAAPEKEPSTCTNCGGEDFHHSVPCYLGEAAYDQPHTD